jgi:hypothetical protein
MNGTPFDTNKGFCNISISGGKPLGLSGAT